MLCFTVYETERVYVVLQHVRVNYFMLQHVKQGGIMSGVTALKDKITSRYNTYGRLRLRNICCSM